MIRIRLIGWAMLVSMFVAVAASDENPLPNQAPMVSIDVDRGLGDRTATLALVAFGDYQCSYCRNFDTVTLPELVRRYIKPGLLRYFHKNFPLRMHAQAVSASIAAYCAGDQERYWQMHRRLYQHQNRLGDALFTELATELSLDVPRFDACLVDRAPQQVIQRDLAEGRALGVSATPTFILGRIENNRVVVERIAHGAAALDVFVREIEALRQPSK